MKARFVLRQPNSKTGEVIVISEGETLTIFLPINVTVAGETRLLRPEVAVLELLGLVDE